MVRIYWSSRHKPLPVQVEWLNKKFGGVEVVIGITGNAAEIAEDFRRKGCDEMVVVAPLWVIYHLLKEGIKPLWADMEVVSPEEKHDLVYRGRCYKFKGFRRIKDIQIIYEEI